MTKKELVHAIQANTGMAATDASEVLESLLEIMKATLETGEDIKVSNFGKFEVKQKDERRGRNPQTGEDIVIDRRQVVTFKPAALLKEYLNQ